MYKIVWDYLDISSGTTSAILDIVLHTLEKKKLTLEKAYEMATDGANILVGVYAGVTTSMNAPGCQMLGEMLHN